MWPLPGWAWIAGCGLAADERATTAIEYALIAAMIILVILGGLHSLGDALLALPMNALITAFSGALS